AALVLELTERVVVEQQLTTLMVTHNMRDAIRYGNRLLMMDRGTILWDVSGEEKRHLTPEKLVQKFFESDSNAAISGELFLSK
ncbi:MAG: ABC transporter ATP-binding protein, partial [Bacilli bacterium]